MSAAPPEPPPDGVRTAATARGATARTRDPDGVPWRAPLAFALVAVALVAIGLGQSWSLALAILNLCLISAVMAIGVNVQWGYAGLFNVGTMAFAALGGTAAVLVSAPPVGAAWRAGGTGIALAAVALGAGVALAVVLRRRLPAGRARGLLPALSVLAGLVAARLLYGPAAAAIEAVDPSRTGYLGGLGLPILFSWLVGGLLAGAAASLIARVALGLRADYLAIATLGISEIVIAVIRNEDWLTRGVKNVTGLPRPVPFERDLQRSDWFVDVVARVHGLRAPSPALTGEAPATDAAPTVAVDPPLAELVVDAANLAVKLAWSALFVAVLAVLLVLARRAQRAPWGRMMRAIRDDETAAEALGKDVVRRHRQAFVVGSAIVGVAGAMLVTLEGQLTPGAYNPLRFTFLIWVMVIVGGSGNNAGAVLGAFVVWGLWIEAEPLGAWLLDVATAGLDADHPLRAHLLAQAAQMRLVVMGVVLLVTLRFAPRGLLPERVRR